MAFLKEHREATYVTLLTTGKLGEYLHKVDEQARGQMRKITADLARQRGIDETLKSTDPVRWAAEMNNCKASAEEIVLWELFCK
ncbi:MAG: TnpV protein [Clostridia bacterium]|nr:TnpV protein [Clostridia bacterium]